MSTYTWMNNNFGAGTSATTVLTTAVTACNVGDLVIVRTCCANNQATTLADNHGNTWTKDVERQEATSLTTIAIWSSVITTQIPIGGTITVTHGAIRGRRYIDGIVCTNPAATPFDTSATSTAAATSAPGISTGSVTPATSDWVGVSMVDYSGSGVTTTPKAGWTEDFDNSASSGSEVQTIIGTSNASVSAGGTASSSAIAYNQVFAIYKLTSGGAATLPLAAGSSTTSGTLGLTATTQVPLVASSSITSGTGAITAATQIPLAAASSSTSGSLTISSGGQVIPFAAGSSTTSGSLALTAMDIVQLAAGSSTTSGTLATTATTQIPFAAGSSTTSGTLALSISNVLVPLNAGSSTTSGTLGLSSPALIAMSGSILTAGTLTGFTGGVPPPIVNGAVNAGLRGDRETSTQTTTDAGRRDVGG